MKSAVSLRHKTIIHTFDIIEKREKMPPYYNENIMKTYPEVCVFWQSPVCKTPEEKMAGAEELCERLKGCFPEKAETTRSHETLHALADIWGAGRFELQQVFFFDSQIQAAYCPIGKRTKEQRLSIIEAPGEMMSLPDKLAAGKLRAEIACGPKAKLNRLRQKIRDIL